MHIGLIDTMDKAVSGRTPNIAVASLAAYLVAHGHKVAVLDLFFSSSKAQADFFADSWDAIGITTTSFALPVCRAVGMRIEKQRGKTKPPIIVGGPHVSVAGEEMFQDSWVDYAVFGEGEITLLSLVRLLEASKQPSVAELSQIKGLMFRNGAHVVSCPPRERIRDLNSLPFPPYEIFPMSSYEYYSLATSRGCPYSCAYCASEAILGRTWVAKSAERVVAEIEELFARWGKKNVQIIDDTFNLQENRVKEFCELLLDKKLDIKWQVSGLRADKTDPEMLRLMKISGCNYVSVGIESANPEVLKDIGKKETAEQIREGILRINQAGIGVNGMFMIGNPRDTLDTVKESIAFAENLPLDEVSFFHAIPYPKTRLWDFAHTHGKFVRADYHNFHDFSAEPIFETEAFPYAERVAAYKAAYKLVRERRSQLFRLGIRRFCTRFVELRTRFGAFTAFKKAAKEQFKAFLWHFGEAFDLLSSVKNMLNYKGKIRTRFSR